MPSQLELCRLETADGETLHGLLHRPPDGGASGDLAVVLVHGVSDTFYGGFMATVAQGLVERGLPALAFNNRGHDWVYGGGGPNEFRGASCERVDDCLLDIDAALAWLAERGFSRFVLFGHSLGSNKVLLYQSRRQRADVVGVVSCSGPQIFYRAKLSYEPGFAELVARTEALVAEGKGDELLFVPSGWGAAGPIVGLYTARAYLEKYGPSSDIDTRPHAARLTCPFLATAGSLEVDLFANYARELAAAAPNGMSHIVEGANHAYAGQETELFDLLAGWATTRVSIH
jgi:pimeloyl-ACP methyl ester carboxylesterase